jgi:hypothetical protein
MSRADNEFICAFSAPSLKTKCGLSPRTLRIVAFAFAFSTAHWVVGGVHGYTAYTRTPSLAASAAGAAQFNILVLRVTYRTNSGLALHVDASNFSTRQFQLGHLALSRDKLGASASTPDQLSATAWLEFDIIHNRTQRYNTKHQTVARFNG